MTVSFINKNKLISTRICYIHVPKCAGTSIIDSIRNQYRLRDRILRKDQFAIMNASASAKGSEIFNEDLWGYREKILSYYLSIKKYKFVSGHFPFSDFAYKQFKNEWNFITILRNPVDRWFSHYFFNRYKKNKHFATKLTLEEYADTEDGRSLGMLYHKIFNGKPDNEIHNINVAYQNAIENIEKLACVGVVEKMENFCKDFNNKFGVKLSVEKKNKNPLSNQDRLNRISDSIYRKIEKICEPDLKIYSYLLNKIK